MSTVHDYRSPTFYWEHEVFVKEVLSEDRIRLWGWGPGIKPGDFVLLTVDVTSDTRYRIVEVDYVKDPDVPDEWHAIGEFAPRYRGVDE
jgi:hypothetical protein